MDQLDIIFRSLTEADCFIINDWMTNEGWPARTNDEVKQDPFGRMKFAETIAAEDRKTRTLLGIASYILPRPNYAYFALYFVNSNYRGMGIGQILWDKAFKDIGDRNVGINSHEMTTKYRERSGFKVIGTQVFRYSIPKSNLLAKINSYLIANDNVDGISVSDVATSEDREKIVKFMQKAESRVERYAEDDHMLGYMDLPNQHTILASDTEGNVVGWATIGQMGDTLDKLSPLHAINDVIFLKLMAGIIGKYERDTVANVLATLSERKSFAIEFVQTVPGAKMVLAMDQSFTKYKEYPEGFLNCFYCW